MGVKYLITITCDNRNVIEYSYRKITAYVRFFLNDFTNIELRHIEQNNKDYFIEFITGSKEINVIADDLISLFLNQVINGDETPNFNIELKEINND